MRVVVAMRRAAERTQARRSRRANDNPPTLEELAAGHAKQYAFTLDRARWICALCSRRAGKTTGIAHRFIRRCLAKAGSNCIYIALTKDQARNVTMWEPIWKPLLKALGIRCKHDETRMITRFENGSVCRFTGSDDVRHIETELGSALDEAVLDECQSAPPSVLEPLIKRILPPALSDRRGTLVMAGTVPDVAAGTFWEVWSKSNWSKHNWSMFDNPHMPNAQEDLDEYLAANPGLTVDSPLIQRERFGRFVFDNTATAYTYTPAINGYVHTDPPWLQELERLQATKEFPAGALLAAVPLPGVDLFSVALDPGSRDRASVQVTGWGSKTPLVQHVFDWTSPPDARLGWDALGKVLGAVAKYISAVWWHYDAGSSKNELDTFQRLYGVPVVKAAEKSDLPGQVRLTNALLTSGRLKIMIGSSVEQDFQRARWDQNARAKGLWQWASGWHPDASEALRYSLKPYFDAYVAPVPEPTSDLDKHRAEIRAMLAEGRAADERDADAGRDYGWG